MEHLWVECSIEWNPTDFNVIEWNIDEFSVLLRGIPIGANVIDRTSMSSMLYSMESHYINVIEWNINEFTAIMNGIPL